MKAKLKKMGLKSIIGNISMTGVVIGIAIGAFVWGAAEILTFLRETIIFSFELFVITAIGLVIVWLSQRVRNTDMYDSNGAAQELDKVRNRIGKSNEKDGDSLAVGIQYASTTIFLAVVIAAKFLMH